MLRVVAPGHEIWSRGTLEGAVLSVPYGSSTTYNDTSSWTIGLKVHIIQKMDLVIHVNISQTTNDTSKYILEKNYFRYNIGMQGDP